LSSLVLPGLLVAQGGDAALAFLEGRPLRAWPFFAVLDVSRPSDAAFGARWGECCAPTLPFCKC